jgi:tetratricopeptide (TPR) repeat protein
LLTDTTALIIVEPNRRGVVLCIMDEEGFSRLKKLLDEQRFDDALNLVEQLVRSKPNDWNAVYLCGVVHRMKGNLGEAIRCYKQSLEINSKDDAVHHALGVAYQQTGDYLSAIAAFETALELQPERFETLNSLGLTLKLSRRFEEALCYYRRAMDSCVDSAFQEVLKNESRYFTSEDVGGERLFRLRPEYFTTMRELLATDPNYFVVAGNLAACYEAIGDHSKAVILRRAAESCTPIDENLIGPIKRWGSRLR